VLAGVTNGLLKIQQACVGFRLDLGQCVRHSSRGLGTVCVVDYDQDKCYSVVYSDGEVHRYDPVQAGVKFKMVDNAPSGVRVAISATALESPGLLDEPFLYALLRRFSDGAVLAKTEWVKPSHSPFWDPLFVPYTALNLDGRAHVEIYYSQMSKADQLIGSTELNLIVAAEQFDTMPLRRKDKPSQMRGALTLRVDCVHESEMPAAVMKDVAVATVPPAKIDATFEKPMLSGSPQQALGAEQRSRRRRSLG